MSLEIRCPQCFSLLNVPDEAAGASAKCPHCSRIFDVDTNLSVDGHERVEASLETTGSESAVASAESVASASQELGSHEMEVSSDVTGSEADNLADTLPHLPDPLPAKESANPYTAPASEAYTELGLAPVAMRHGKLDASLAFQFAWSIFRANMGILVMTHGTVFLISLSIAIFAEVIRQQGLEAAAFALEHPINYCIQWYLMIGLVRITLAIARGNRQVEYNDLFAGTQDFPAVFMYTLLFWLMVVLGSLLLIFPGIYLACRFWPGVHLIVDRGMDVRTALRKSSEFTAGNLTQSAIVGVYSVVVALVGVLMFYVGLLLTLPLYSMLWTISFLMITRQPIPTTFP